MSTSPDENSEDASNQSPTRTLDLPLNSATAIQLWMEAKGEEIGIKFAVPPQKREQIKSRLYEARKELGDGYEDLMIATPIDEDLLYIVKKGTEIDW